MVMFCNLKEQCIRLNKVHVPEVPTKKETVDSEPAGQVNQNFLMHVSSQFFLEQLDLVLGCLF